MSRRPAYTKAERAARWAKLGEYLRRTRTLKEAIALARREHVVAPTSAWVTAYGKLIGTGRGPKRRG